jgi:hypothetical protein
MGIGMGEDVVAVVGVAGRYGKKTNNDFFSVPLLPGFFCFQVLHFIRNVFFNCFLLFSLRIYIALPYRNLQ